MRKNARSGEGSLTQITQLAAFFRNVPFAPARSGEGSLTQITQLAAFFRNVPFAPESR
jgi:hypothetical protein